MVFRALEIDIHTLLTRQMELYSVLRHPPKTPEELLQTRESVWNYCGFFDKLRHFAKQLSTELETVFQCLMYVCVGGALSFDGQHQDESMPMHQAKVLARNKAIAMEPALRNLVPHAELMVYVGLSKDLRNTFRVKVEDGNDLRTVKKFIDEAAEYLDYIYSKAGGDAQRMFSLYMAEEPGALTAILHAYSGDEVSLDHTFKPIMGASTNLVRDLSTTSIGELPFSMPEFVAALEGECNIACDVKRPASERLLSAQNILSWMKAVPHAVFVAQVSEMVPAVTSCLNVLAGEKRSALCRLGCECIIALVQRLVDEPYMTEDCLSRETSPSPLGRALALWAATLTKGLFVTIAAISTSTDRALRELVLCSHGHPSVVKAILGAMQNGTQTELRRRCLGYLALSVVAPAGGDSQSIKRFGHRLVELAQKYVLIGDSPSRKMARALCTVLREVGHLPLSIADSKTEKLIALERNQILPLLTSPRVLENFLFEQNRFIRSLCGGRHSTSRCDSNSYFGGSSSCSGLPTSRSSVEITMLPTPPSTSFPTPLQQSSAFSASPDLDASRTPYEKVHTRDSVITAKRITHHLSSIEGENLIFETSTTLTPSPTIGANNTAGGELFDPTKKKCGKATGTFRTPSGLIKETVTQREASLSPIKMRASSNTGRQVIFSRPAPLSRGITPGGALLEMAPGTVLACAKQPKGSSVTEHAPTSNGLRVQSNATTRSTLKGSFYGEDVSDSRALMSGLLRQQLEKNR